MRIEVSLPLHYQVTASLHHPCAGAFPPSTSTLPIFKAAGYRLGEVKTRHKQLVWLLDIERFLSRQGGFQVTGKRMGYATSMARGKDGKKHKNSFYEIRSS